MKILWAHGLEGSTNGSKPTWIKENLGWDVVPIDMSERGWTIGEQTAVVLDKILENEEIEIIICDQRMEETTGVEFFTEIIKKHPNPIRILLTAFTDVDVIIDAINYGHIYQYIRKPFIYNEMKELLFNASKLYHLRKDKNLETIDESQTLDAE